MFAKSKLGPTPLSLPIILILFAAFMAFRTTKKILSNREKGIWKEVFCLLVWGSLIILNLYHFNGILYVT